MKLTVASRGLVGGGCGSGHARVSDGRLRQEQIREPTGLSQARKERPMYRRRVVPHRVFTWETNKTLSENI